MFNRIIEDHIVSNPYPPRVRVNNRHWPSEGSYVMKDGTVIGKCAREQYFIRKKYPVDRGRAAHHIRKMETGKSIEQNEIGHAKDIGIHVDDDVEFLLDLGDILISGRMDAIYIDSNGNKVCVEYKTSEGYFFERDVYGRFGRLRAEPKPENILQVMLYLKAFPDMPYADIIYINRDKLDVIEHIVKLVDDVGEVNGEVTEFTLDGIYNRYRELTVYLDNNEVPPCDFQPEYPKEELEDLRNRGVISKKVYDLWLTESIIPGHGRCMHLCGFRNTCMEPNNSDTQITDNRSGAIVNLESVL